VLSDHGWRNHFCSWLVPRPAVPRTTLPDASPAWRHGSCVAALKALDSLSPGCSPQEVSVADQSRFNSVVHTCTCKREAPPEGCISVLAGFAHRSSAVPKDK
jgi:hypothetical protein